MEAILKYLKTCNLPDCRSLSCNRYEAPCPPPIWLPNVLFHGPELLSCRLCVPKSVVVVLIILHHVKALGVWALAQEQWGGKKFTGLPCQKQKSKTLFSTDNKPRTKSYIQEIIKGKIKHGYLNW